MHWDVAVNLALAAPRWAVADFVCHHLTLTLKGSYAPRSETSRPAPLGARKITVGGRA